MLKKTTFKADFLEENPENTGGKIQQSRGNVENSDTDSYHSTDDLFSQTAPPPAKKPRLSMDSTKPLPGSSSLGAKMSQKSSSGNFFVTPLKQQPQKSNTPSPTSLQKKGSQSSTSGQFFVTLPHEKATQEQINSTFSQSASNLKVSNDKTDVEEANTLEDPSGTEELEELTANESEANKEDDNLLEGNFFPLLFFSDDKKNTILAFDFF